MTNKNLIPPYKIVYTSDSVELDDISSWLSQDTIDQWTCLAILSNSCRELKADFNNYLLDTYGKLEVAGHNLTYPDIGNIAHFVVRKFKSKDTACFRRIFENAEIILIKGDESTKKLMVAGFLENIQNIGGWHEVNYHAAFDEWLRPQSQKAWNDLIEGWEGKRNK